MNRYTRTGSHTGPAVAERRGIPVVTLLLCAACLLLFLAISLSVPDPESADLLRWGSATSDQVWNGAYWALLSSAVVHFEIWHLAINVYWLWHLGRAAEKTLGAAEYIAFLLASAFVSSAAELAVSGDMGIGASGIAYALFGLICVGRHIVPALDQAMDEKTIAGFWIWLVGCIVVTQFADVSIGNWAHVAGVAFGLLFGTVLFGAKYRTVCRIGTAAMVLGSAVPLLGCPWTVSWVGSESMKAHEAGRLDEAIAGYRRYIRMGGDLVWAYQNIALAYYSKGSTAEYSATLRDLRQTDSAAADEVERDIGQEEGAENLETGKSTNGIQTE